DGAGRFPPDGAEPRGDGRPQRDPRCAAWRLRAGGGGTRHVGRHGRDELRETGGDRHALWCVVMTLSDQGMLEIGAMRLEYRMIGPRPGEAPTIVMLHEGLGCVGLWGDFPDQLQQATGAGIFVYSRAGYGKSSPVALPRPLTFMHEEARQVLPKLLDAIGFQRGLLLGHSDGASIAAIYAGSVQDHRVRGLVLIAPHFFTEDMGI